VVWVRIPLWESVKTCPKCRQDLEDSEFHPSRRKGRKPGLQSYCKSCNKKSRLADYYANPGEWRSRTKKARGGLKLFVDSLKANKPCTDCNGSFSPEMLDFDHLTDKEFSISLAVRETYSRKRILDEIAKCELVCPNCHRLRTMRRRTGVQGGLQNRP